MAIKAGMSVPERYEKHANKNWVDLGFNHKTTLTMGNLIPMACKELYPGEYCKVYMEVMMRFAALFLPIMHQCYFTVDWFYVRTQSLFDSRKAFSFESFIKQDPNAGTVGWAYTIYQRAVAVSTDCIMNYLGFNAPPGGGTLIAQTTISAIPASAYHSIWKWYFRNPNIQVSNEFLLVPGDNEPNMQTAMPDFKVLRRNWPRDYYTVATLQPQQGDNVLIPSYTMAEDGDYVPQKLFNLDGSAPSGVHNVTTTATNPTYLQANSQKIVLQLSSTVRDLRYAVDMTAFLERATRAGAGTNDLDTRWSDFVKRYFDWDPNPLMIDRPVWIGGYTGNVVISDVMSTAEAGEAVVGDYAGKAMVRDNTPAFTYTAPDYGVIMPVLTVYPKASYYSGMDRIWTRDNKMAYMWEQFALIGDQPLKNKEVWFSWYDADIDWNEEIFGYVPQYHWERYSNDIVSGQMRTLWQSFHLGRNFTAASDVVLNSEFIECRPDIGRVFDVDAEAGEHECYVHAYIGIEVLRRLPRNGIPALVN